MATLAERRRLEGQIMSKRVCLIGKYRFPHDSRLKQQADILAANGLDVTVFCLRGAGEKASEQIGSNIKVKRLLKRYSLDKKGFLPYLKETLSFGLSLFLNLSVQLFNKPFDIIVIHTLPEFLVFSVILPKLSGKYIILDARDLTVDLLSSRWKGAWVYPSRLLAQVIEKCCCIFSDHIITASDGFRERLILRGIPTGKITVLQNTADKDIFSPVKRRHFPIGKEINCIYHGTISRRFGVIKAAEALVHLREMGMEANLYLYGTYDYNYKEEIIRFIADNNIANNIFLNGLKSKAELFEIFKDMDIGIVPYIGDDFMHLALSTKMFEYVASGIPVAASRTNSSLRIFSEESIQYSEPGNGRDLAEKIYQLSTDKDIMQCKVRNAFNDYKMVSGEVIGSKFYELIKNSLKESK